MFYKNKFLKLKSFFINLIVKNIFATVTVTEIPSHKNCNCIKIINFIIKRLEKYIAQV